MSNKGRGFLQHSRSLYKYWDILPWVLIVIVLGLGAYLRLNRLEETMGFLGDQGRDSVVVWNMVKSGVPVQLGPAPSFNTYFRGPAYYYLLLIPFIVTGGNPVAGAICNAVIDCFTIFLLFLVGKRFFSSWVGVTAAAFWAVAPWALIFARAMWNPNPLPFFVLAVVYALSRIIGGDTRWILVLAPIWAIGWQLHDQFLLMLPIIALIWIYFRPQIAGRLYLSAIGLGFLSLAPFLFYEITHRFNNTFEMLKVILGAFNRNSGVSTNPTALQRLQQVFEQLQLQIPSGTLTWTPLAFKLALVLGGISLLFWLRGRTTRQNSIIFTLWLLTPVLYYFWPVTPAMHYMTMLLPLPFLLVGLGIDAMRRPHPLIGAIIALFLIFTLANGFNWERGGIRTATVGSGSLGTTELVTERILATTNGRPYAFRLLTVSGSIEHDISPYRYLLGLHGQPPADRADLDTYLAYRPPEYADGASRQGIVINGVKLVRQAPPKVGPNLLVNGNFGATTEKERAAWKQTSGSSPSAKIQQSDDGTALMLIGPRGADPNYAITLIQELPLTGEKQYLVRFKYRNEGAIGVQRLYFQTRGAKDDFFPSGAGYVAKSTGEWAVGSFIATAAPGTTAATIWLSVNGPGKVWFTDVEVSEVLSGTVIP